MEVPLRAGIAVYNAGHHHAAHDAWEPHWLALGSGTDDERFLHGLIQFTAAVFHAHNRNWSGAAGLAESAVDYLDGLPDDYREVNVETVRTYLAALARDPERIERTPAPALTYGGDALSLDDLDFDATAVAADVLAEELDYDEALVEQATEYARADIGADEASSPFVTLLFDFVREPSNRALIVQRLEEHATRRAARESDVEGLFESRDD